jgi:hypothetical protein
MTYDSDDGFFHLTLEGWVRKDDEPFSEGRVETWRYSMLQSSGWSEVRRRLHCRWVDPNRSRVDRDAIRKRFGWPYGLGEGAKDYIGEPL